MKFDNQLRYAINIVTSYQGETPLHVWLKDFFRQHKQMGSRDRKTAASLVYGFYRLGHTGRELPLDQRILLGFFLTTAEPAEFLEYFNPAWNKQATLPLEEKIAMVDDFQVTDIFPWKNELSEGIDHYAFCLSFLRQPDLFLRIRPGHEQQALHTVSTTAHEFIPPFTLRLPNGTSVEERFTPDKEVVVQDYSSQRIAAFLQPSSRLKGSPADLHFWDACAASGGKSILAYDLLPGLDITVSDIRESILKNLQQRFRQAGIKEYHSFAADLSKPDPWLPAGKQDLILADVPCTGSGTWSRTPEEMYFFDPKKILHYNATQKSILANLIPTLSRDAALVYSTCSVFKKENEEITAFIREKFGLREEKADILKGYDLKADTMFAARFLA